MYVLRLECPASQKDLLIAELWERGTEGIQEEDLPGGGCALQAFFDAPFEAAFWAEFGARWGEAADRDWVEVAQSLWQPLLVGSRLFLAPAWSHDPTPPGRVRLEMQPGQACGTGWGPATQLALEALECRLRPGARVLDLGTGSGILAVAAARLGAGRVYACDIDADAARIAQERFRGEGLAVGLFVGSVRAVATASMDLLVANINAETLTTLAPEIERVLKPGGAAALAGFTACDIDRMRAAFPKATLKGTDAFSFTI
jgi:ribosomal protein L11 methyltransferase